MQRGVYKRGMSIEERFWIKVSKSIDSECWLWTSNTNWRGYGQFRLKGKRTVAAHRFAYELMVGPIPSGLNLDHICHNTACVNPKHLRICTQAENVRNQVLNKRNLSGFKGVSKMGTEDRWSAKIRVNGVTTNLGTFTTPNAAHIAYRNAARTLHGEFANFGDKYMEHK